jgi:hypothetical protein
MCCKTLFCAVDENFRAVGRDFRVKMWGTSSPDDKLAGDLRKAIAASEIRGCRLNPVMARKLGSAISEFCNTFGGVAAEPSAKIERRSDLGATVQRD